MFKKASIQFCRTNLSAADIYASAKYIYGTLCANISSQSGKIFYSLLYAYSPIVLQTLKNQTTNVLKIL